MATDRPSPPPAPGSALALLGAAVPLGWVLHDLAVVAASGRPVRALDLLPLSALAVGLGALLGRLGRRWALVAVAGLATGVWSALPVLLDRRFTHTEAWLPRALFLLVAAYGLARLVGERRPGRARVGLLLGVLACALVAELRGVRRPLSWPALSMALALVAAGGLPRRGWRLAGTLAALALPVAWLLPRVLETSRVTRPDLGPPAVRAPAEHPNLLLVILDTVRADHLAPYGYERETTPLLDRWVREHFTVYTSARSTSSWTLPSHASLFTGLFPAQHGAAPPGAHAQPIRDEATTLAERLRAAGFRTAGIMSNNVYLRARRPDGGGQAFGMERGFEHFDDRLASAIGPYLTLTQLLGGDLRLGHMSYRDARVITDLALDWLDRRGPGPFFLALNYMDAHGPNMPPAPFDRRFGPEQPGDPLTPEGEHQVLLYDRELAHLDAHLDRLLAGLEERGLLDDTAVIVTADHGEALGEHGFYWHGWVLYDALVHVPLYVKPAGGRTAERVDEDVSGADVFRLALELAGVDAPEPQPQGPPVDGLVGELYVHPGGVADMERITGLDLKRNLLSWKQDGIKYIVSSRGEVEAYDLAADPDELAPLELDEERVGAALERARAWWLAWPVELEGAGDLEEDALERMRALGYLGEEAEPPR